MINNANIFPPKLVARIIDVFRSQIRETLAGRPSDNQVNLWHAVLINICNVTANGMINPKVGSIGCSRMRIELNCEDRFETSIHEALRHPTAACEEVDHRWHGYTVRATYDILEEPGEKK